MAPKLLDQMRDAIRIKHYSYRTEETYLDWARRYILFHGKRHPTEMGATEIQAFLAHLASERKVAAATHTAPAVGAGEIKPSAPSSSCTVKFSIKRSNPSCSPAPNAPNASRRF